MTALGHGLWLGGASAAKTTVGPRLARRHGLRWYSTDHRTWAHRDTAIAAGHEAAARWEAMTPDERAEIAAADPAELVHMSLDLERGPMIVDDLRRLPPEPLVLAEGSAVLPELVAQGHAERGRAAWLLPSFERHRAFHERGGMEELFSGALAQGPRAERPEERRELLRHANAAVAQQARDHLARTWTTGDESTFRRAFVCECDDPDCTQMVELAVADYTPGVIAHASR